MRTREDRESALKDMRPNRVPLHEQRRNRLTISDRDPNYVYRIVNDIDNRINNFSLAGWEVVEHSTSVGDDGVQNNNVSLGSGARITVGNNTKAILMRIPKSLYDEDQKIKQREIDEKEMAMKRNIKKSGDEGTYGEIEISRK